MQHCYFTASWCFTWVACSLPHLVVHGVNPLSSQKLCGLMNQICSATWEHPEAQIQLELGWSSFCIQTFKRLETALWPAGKQRLKHESASASSTVSADSFTPDWKQIYDPRVQPVTNQQGSIKSEDQGFRLSLISQVFCHWGNINKQNTWQVCPD